MAYTAHPNCSISSGVTVSMYRAPDIPKPDVILWEFPKPDVILWEFLSGIASVLTEGTNMSVLSDRRKRRIFLPYVTTHACAGASTFIHFFSIRQSHPIDVRQTHRFGRTCAAGLRTC